MAGVPGCEGQNISLHTSPARFWDPAVCPPESLYDPVIRLVDSTPLKSLARPRARFVSNRRQQHQQVQQSRLAKSSSVPPSMISRPAKDQPSKELPSATAVIASETAAAAAAALRAEIDMGGTARMRSINTNNAEDSGGGRVENAPAESQTGENTDTPKKKKEKERTYESDS